MTDETDTDEKRTVHSTWEEDDDPSSAVVEAVATATGQEVSTKKPLYDYVEAEALDSLLRRARRDGRSVTVALKYNGVEVVVDSRGTVEVVLPSEE